MSFRLKPFVLTAFAIVFSAVPAFSQMAFVQGIITDIGGKTVTGAVVAFQSTETGNKVEVKSDKKGHYIANVKPGIYAVTVTLDGKLRQAIRQYDAVGGHGDPLDIKLQPAW
jgi:hypothetical protein